MRHLDLFAGIGGFSLAARNVGWETVAHCEINSFCQKVLHKHFPEAKLHADIKELDGSEYRGSVDIVTGGFPCQPYSTAGKRMGKEDERHLWPEMLRVIRGVQPAWVVGENVLGLVNWNDGVVFNEVQTDLEMAGFRVVPFVLPACGVEAPHRRYRVWFIAYSNSNDARRSGYEQSGCTPKESEIKTWEQWFRNESKRNAQERSFTNTNIGGLQGLFEKKKEEQSTYGNAWSNWPSVEPGIPGGNDGVPNRMERIKALGNAIVPQIAEQIFKAINQYNAL